MAGSVPYEPDTHRRVPGRIVFRPRQRDEHGRPAWTYQPDNDPASKDAA